MFMPRFFAWRSNGAGSLRCLVEHATLVPTVQNVSQFVYISISVLSVFTFARLLRADACGGTHWRRCVWVRR